MLTYPLKLVSTRLDRNNDDKDGENNDVDDDCDNIGHDDNNSVH